MLTQAEIEQELRTIKERNQRVEVDKAWETSWWRRLFIASTTYVIAMLWLLIIDNDHPGLNAFIPTIGYILSTLSLPFIKRWWINSQLKSK